MTLTETIYGDSAAELAAPAGEVTPDIAGLRLVLQAVTQTPEALFDLSSWKCGTTACAIGSFCSMNPDDELKLRPSDEFKTWLIPTMDGADYFFAVGKRFGITSVRAEYLFGSAFDDDEEEGTAPGPRDREELIERLTAFIEANELEGRS